jgi:hypothetical protein
MLYAFLCFNICAEMGMITEMNIYAQVRIFMEIEYLCITVRIFK